MEDQYLRERGSDIEAIGDRLLRTLLGLPEVLTGTSSAPGTIGVGSILSPIDALHLPRSGLVAFAAERGGKTAHASIILRALEIPFVVGVRGLTAAVRPGDRLIVDAEIYESATAISSRDNPVGQRFAFAPLASLGVTRDDGDLRFEERRDERHEGLCVITRQFQTARDLRLTVVDREITLQRGERVSLSFNYTYSMEAFRWVLTEQGGLTILQEFPSSDGRYVTVVCSRE